MIKMIAALTMLIDHIGIVFSPTIYAYRIIGRLSMPLYAYCIARGFYYSKQHHTLKRYIIRMLILSLASQLPYYWMCGAGLNIGFTWLFSLLLLTIGTAKYDIPCKRIISFSIVTFIFLYK